MSQKIMKSDSEKMRGDCLLNGVNLFLGGGEGMELLSQR